jgi:Leucine-rich repeat (LRR) protein
LTSLHVGRNNIPEKEMREIMAIAVRMDNMKILCEVPFKDKALTGLDISRKNLGMEGALVVAEYLDGNRAISSINLLKNYIPVEQAQELVQIMQAKEKLVTLCGLSKEETELDFSGQDLSAGDAVLIANDISDMGALSSLNLASNHLGELVYPIGWTKTGYSRGLGTYRHTDGRKQDDPPEGSKPEGIIAIANTIPNMRALTCLDISRNNLRATGCKALAEALALAGNQAMKELNVASNQLTLKADATKLSDVDMSGVTALAGVISDMGALSVLNLDDNALLLGGCKAICDALKANTTVTSLSMSNNGFQTKSAEAIAEMLGDNGALTSLNLSSNRLYTEGGKVVAEAIKVSICEIVVVLASVSCPFDHWLDCCCSLLSTG